MSFIRVATAAAIIFELTVGSALAGPSEIRVEKTIEIQVSDDDTYFTLELATKGKKPVRFLSARQGETTTHLTTVPVSVADRWARTLEAEVVVVMGLECPHPRTYTVRNARSGKAVAFCADRYSENRRKKIQTLVDEMTERLRDGSLRVAE